MSTKEWTDKLKIPSYTRLKLSGVPIPFDLRTVKNCQQWTVLFDWNYLFKITFKHFAPVLKIKFSSTDTRVSYLF